MQNKKILVVTQHFWPENFRINDIVEGFLADGVQVDVLCGLPNYPKGEWFPGYSANGPWQENYKGAHVYRCREISRKGNTGLRIFANYCSWPLFARFSLHRLPGGSRSLRGTRFTATSPMPQSIMRGCRRHRPCTAPPRHNGLCAAICCTREMRADISYLHTM